MENPRIYGSPPYSTAVIHGGPGAAGDMALVAKELSRQRGVLEPLQTEPTIEGLIKELRALLQKHADLPVTLVGHSWGAWLSFIFAARHPGMVKKLILIGSGPFEEQYVPLMNETRFLRLTAEERSRAEALTRALNDPAAENKKEILRKLGEVFSRADSFNPVNDIDEDLDLRPELFLSVMKESQQLRKSGALIDIGMRIKCPVIAIHGDYDPHPHQGVAEPLSRILADFRLILLERCGHYPWKEQYARDDFFSLLAREVD